jgi:GNAT superfamily N-acetyltransferase
MSDDILSIITADLRNPVHCTTIIDLINEYRCDPMGGEIGTISCENERALIDGLKSHPSCIIYFVMLNDAIAGMAVCFIGFSTFRIKRLLNIHDYILFKKFRKQGIGTLGLQKIAELVGMQGFCKLTLEVRMDNIIAKKVYTKSGFSPGTYPMEFWAKDL